MSEKDYFDNTPSFDDINQKPQDAGGEQIHQEGAYGWQSTIPAKKTAEGEAIPSAARANMENASAEQATVEDTSAAQAKAETAGTRSDAGRYMYTGAYAEASADELGRAAKEARRYEKQQKKAAKRQGKKKRSLVGRVAAALLCGVLFGGATAGAFIGVLHLTGYVDQMEKVLDAAKQVEEFSKEQSDSIQTGTNVTPVISEGDSDVQAVYKMALPAVVAITNTAVYDYNFGFGSYTDEVQGSGSGIIIGKNDTELLIVTNYHVIEDADSLTVTFVDNETVEAYVKGTAEANDLAVVAVMLADMKVSTKSAITIATLGSEDEVQVGQKVEAIGNALGYGQVMTVGYISAVDRQVTIDGKEMTLLQTDAAINPGNSGGALLNMKGEVIGINSAKYSDTDVEGMGFAIPISLVKEIIDELMNQETLIKVDEAERGYIGIGAVSIASNNGYGMPAGALVRQISENTPAADSDLRMGDIITGLDNHDIDSMEELSSLLEYYRGGTTVTLTVQRLVDGRYQEMKIELVLGYRKNYDVD